MISPRRARYSKAASASEAEARSAGVGWSRPVGRLYLTSFFSHLTDALAAELDPGLAGEHGGEFLTTPLGMARAVLERVVVDEAIKVVRQLAGHPGGGDQGAGDPQGSGPRGGQSDAPICAARNR